MALNEKEFNRMWGEGAPKKARMTRREQEEQRIHQQKVQQLLVERDQHNKKFFCLKLMLSAGYLLYAVTTAFLFATITKTLLNATSFGNGITLLDMAIVYACMWIVVFFFKAVMFFTK